MPAGVFHAFRVVLLALLCASHAAQQPESPQPEKTTLPSGIDRLAGQDATSHIQYVRLILPGSLRTASSMTAPPPSPAPMLIAQCTLRPNGKSNFELFANFGGATDLAFYPPWTPISPQNLFPPRTEKAVFTMEFLGYTHVKPVRHQWEIPVQTPGQYRYNPPGGGSSTLKRSPTTFVTSSLCRHSALRSTIAPLSSSRRRFSARFAKNRSAGPPVSNASEGSSANYSCNSCISNAGPPVLCFKRFETAC